jgi:hypothetical protein
MKKIVIALIRKFFWSPSRARISRGLKNDTKWLIAGIKFIEAEERNVAIK